MPDKELDLNKPKHSEYRHSENRHSENRHFGYRYLGFIFRSLVILRDTGFCFKKKNYAWKDITGVEAYQKVIQDEGGAYGMGRGEIHLNNGVILLIKEESLERKDGGREVGFSSTFDELMFELKARHKNKIANKVKNSGKMKF